jgi:hypothetical protein
MLLLTDLLLNEAWFKLVMPQVCIETFSMAQTNFKAKVLKARLNYIL